MKDIFNNVPCVTSFSLALYACLVPALRLVTASRLACSLLALNDG